MTDNEQLYARTLLAYRAYVCALEDSTDLPSSCRDDCIIFNTPYGAIQSVPGMENEYQTFKNEVLAKLGASKEKIEDVLKYKLLDAIYKVIDARYD